MDTTQYEIQVKTSSPDQTKDESETITSSIAVTKELVKNKGSEPNETTTPKTATSKAATPKTTTPKMTTPKTATPKVPRVFTSEEIGRITDLGLGRGVNAIQPSPWLNKSTFQVREVTLANIIGTDEGGFLQNYIQEVSSVKEIQTSMSLSVPIDKQVTIGVDAELSRRYSTKRRSVGKKLITRSFSYKPELDNVATVAVEPEPPQPLAQPALTQQVSGGTSPTVELVATVPDQPQPSQSPAQPAPAEQVSGGKQTISPQLQPPQPPAAAQPTPTQQVSGGMQTTSPPPTFEQRLAMWIMQRMPGVEMTPKDDPVEKLVIFIEKMQGDNVKYLHDKCLEFIYSFNVTHYVSRIDLGASEYEVLSEEEYYRQVGMKNNLDVLKAISANTAINSTTTVFSKSSHKSQIGRFDANMVDVKRGTTDEAVVGIKVQPISALINSRVLKTALQKAIEDYIEQQQNFNYDITDKQMTSRAGPFIISCNNETIFLKVTENFKVVATTSIEDSSKFFIDYNEEEQQSYKFSISHEKPSPLKGAEVNPISRYLCAHVNIFGSNTGPLELRFDATDKHTKMTLYSRRVRNYKPVDLDDWLSSRDICYLSCKQKAVGIKSYICVKPTPRNSRITEEYITSCVPSVKVHNESNAHYMLFRLLRATTQRGEKIDYKSGVEPRGKTNTENSAGIEMVEVKH